MGIEVGPGWSSTHCACIRIEAVPAVHLTKVFEAMRRQLSETDVNAQSASGNTPLHIASAQDCPELVAFLLRKGADVTASNHSLETPLHHAALHGSLDVIKMLLEADADVNADDENGQTVLHWALQRQDYLPVTKLLLDYGAVTDEFDLDGNNAVFVAVLEGAVEALPLLLASSDALVKNDAGFTPLQQAVVIDSLDCFSVLMAATMPFWTNAYACLSELIALAKEHSATDCLNALANLVTNFVRGKGSTFSGRGVSSFSDDLADSVTQMLTPEAMDELQGRVCRHQRSLHKAPGPRKATFIVPWKQQSFSGFRRRGRVAVA